MNSQQNPDLAVHPSAIPIEGLLGESDITLEKNVIATQLSESAQLKARGNPKFTGTLRSHNLWTKVAGSSRETRCIVTNGTKVGEKLGTRWLSRTHSNR
ncbi:hypothetical protein [Nostoc sp.]|uniref:hypothetical protein n=1 Tax=Nostoc sp. TaxID=1180 RepID=UPI002FF56536